MYWGDAKFDSKRTVDDFVGNRAFARPSIKSSTVRWLLVPPILHFSKRTTGVLRFNGLCILDRLEFSWFEDHGRPVRNYRAHLTILDEEFVDVAWLHSRMMATPRQISSGGGPTRMAAISGRSHRPTSRVGAIVRSTASQLPTVGSVDAGVLLATDESDTDRIRGRSRIHLPRARRGPSQHHPDRPTADGGFDFFGTFTLPPPIQYEIPFLGEAKRYARGTAVGPKDVSRLVARLARGQYGIFVTTSYFTKQTQEEVLEDRYPTTLVAGADLVRIMREMRIAKDSEISASWLRSVQNDVER